METVSLGFPKASLLNHFTQEQITVINEKELIINGYHFEEQSYNDWLNSIPLSIKENKNKEKVEMKNDYR